MKKWLSLCVLLLISSIAFSQDVPPLQHQKSVLRVQDSLPTVDLKQVEVYSHRRFLFFWQRWRITHLIYNVKKVYPYAKTAGVLLKEYSARLEHVKSETERRKIMKEAEDQLKEKYGHQLEELNFSQGIILIKLIDRETSQSSYALVKDLRGNFVAFFYQGLARIWGYNLKVKYDPKGKDREIETIVNLINQGKL
ncbi:MAG: DUF4294 domain-containing protein [Bacteroidales bacterium]|nr:DUF4294 domain-containing protein [Bacteroidales bacterium]